VGRKEIAQKELWMRKKLTIKDAHPMCFHTMSTKANLDDFTCYIWLLVLPSFSFLWDGASCGCGCSLEQELEQSIFFLLQN